MHSASSAKALLPCGGDLAQRLSEPWLEADKAGHGCQPDRALTAKLPINAPQGMGGPDSEPWPSEPQGLLSPASLSLCLPCPAEPPCSHSQAAAPPWPWVCWPFSVGAPQLAKLCSSSFQALKLKNYCQFRMLSFSCLVIHVYEVFFILLFSDIFLTFLCIMSTFSETYFSKNLLSVSC